MNSLLQHIHQQISVETSLVNLIDQNVTCVLQNGFSFVLKALDEDPGGAKCDSQIRMGRPQVKAYVVSDRATNGLTQFSGNAASRRDGS